MHDTNIWNVDNNKDNYSNPTENPFQLDVQLTDGRLGPCLRRRAQSPASLCSADPVTGKENVDYVDPPHSENHHDRRSDPPTFGRVPYSPSSPTFPSSAAPFPFPSANQPEPTSYNPEQLQHKLKSYIPIPTPFEYSDDDGDDFRGYYDFDRAWAGFESDPNTDLASCATNTTARQQLGQFWLGTRGVKVLDGLERSQELVESPETADSSPGLSSSPSSTGSGTSCGTILTPKTPYDDQEYCDVMYRLDLGAESPYLGAAYAEAFGSGYQISQPPSVKLRARASMDSDATSSSTKSSADANSVSSSKYNTYCGICLRKAISPCRTRCCGKLFCWAHISDWLKSKESSDLCPSCDTVCVLLPVADESSRTSGGSSSSPPSSTSHSRTSSSASTSSSTSGSSTKFNTNVDSSATLTLGSIDDETEDLWDVKSAWKKKGGGSLDLVEIVREVVGDIVGGSIKFVGLSGGIRPTKQLGTVERRFNLSPKELVKEFGTLRTVTGVEKVEEIGEVGVAKRMLSIFGLVFVLFVLFR